MKIVYTQQHSSQFSFTFRLLWINLLDSKRFKLNTKTKTKQTQTKNQQFLKKVGIVVVVIFIYLFLYSSFIFVYTRSDSFKLLFYYKSSTILHMYVSSSLGFICFIILLSIYFNNKKKKKYDCSLFMYNTSIHPLHLCFLKYKIYKLGSN